MNELRTTPASGDAYAEFCAVIAEHRFVPETRRCSAGCDNWPCKAVEKAGLAAPTTSSTRPSGLYREK